MILKPIIDCFLLLSRTYLTLLVFQYLRRSWVLLTTKENKRETLCSGDVLSPGLRIIDRNSRGRRSDLLKISNTHA